MLDYGYYNLDCMEGMREFPDKYFDLAIVDPPYGDAGVSGGVLEPLRGKIRPVHRCTYSATRENGVFRTGGTWAAKFGKKS